MPTARPPVAPPARFRWYLDPRLHLCLNGLLTTAAELLLKVGASRSAAPAWGSGLSSALGVSALGSWWVWVGIAVHVLSLVNWLYVLRFWPLAIAVPIASLAHALIPLGAWAFLGEAIRFRRWCGIALIIFGISLIAKPMMRAEQVL